VTSARHERPKSAEPRGSRSPKKASEGFHCLLDDGGRASQAERWRAQRPYVVSSVRSGNSFRVTFDATCHDELVALVAIERCCCSWAVWSLSAETSGSILEVAGPAAEIAALADAFGM
jgi:hypothetical protein